MENGDQVSKRECFCPQESRGGGVIIPRILGGVSNPNNPPLFTPLAQTVH